MLKIFKSDIVQTNLNLLLQPIINSIYLHLISNVPVKNFFKDFFRLEEMQIKSFIGEVIGKISDGEEIFQTNNVNIEFFNIYHKLYKILDELSVLKNLKSKQNINRNDYNKGIGCMLSLNDLIDELESNNIDLPYPIERICDIQIEEINVKRINKERKEEIFCKIDAIYTRLSELHNVLIQINDIFSYNKNISPIRKSLASCLTINSCPYCNLNMLCLTKVDLGNNEIQISAYCELDHILPQSKYPLLASSIWNLVPVCHDCNSKKSDKLISFNSWKLDLDNEKFKTKILYEKTKAILEYVNGRGYEDFEILGIEVTANNPANETDIRILDLEARYSEHMISINSKQLLTLMIDGLRKSTSMNISELLNITNAKDPASVFSYYFKIMFCDYKDKHYNKVTYGKLISEFLRDHELDENLFEI